MISGRFLICLALFVISHARILGVEKGDVLLHEDFNQIKAGDMGTQALQHELIELVKGAGPDGSDAIRVSYVGYERGSKRVVFRHPLTTSTTSAILEFDVLFEQDFQWVLGGKLHGLGPAKPITGGKPRLPHGWSARITFKPDGHCASYLYDQAEGKTYGIGETSANPVFKKGHWYHVKLELQLNTPGVADGAARISINNQPVVHTRGVQFRGVDGEHTEIQQLLFSTFHGGHQPKNAPIDASGEPVTVHALFDNFHVRKADLRL